MNEGQGKPQKNRRAEMIAVTHAQAQIQVQAQMEVVMGGRRRGRRLRRQRRVRESRSLRFVHTTSLRLTRLMILS